MRPSMKSILARQFSLSDNCVGGDRFGAGDSPTNTCVFALLLEHSPDGASSFVCLYHIFPDRTLCVIDISQSCSDFVY